MANAMTPHSIELRKKTTKAWLSKLTKANKFVLVSKDVEKISAIKEMVNSIPDGTNTEIVYKALKFYSENQNGNKP